MTTCPHSTGLPHYLRWCVLSTPEIQKCGDMAVAFSRQRLKPEIQCVSAESPQDCMERIQVGSAPGRAERPGGRAMAVPRMILTHPPPAPPGLEVIGQPGEEKKVSCGNPTEKGKEEGHMGTAPAQGIGQKEAVSPEEPRDSSLSWWPGAEGM